MRMSGLSLETIPPLHIPLRFFYTAPWMGCIAALLLLGGADDAFASRWSPQVLALTHLLTLGFMAMVMLGAMFQLVPVISGRLLPGGTAVATAVHVSLVCGALLLAAGFALRVYSLFAWAVPLLLLAFGIFLAALGAPLLRRSGGGDAVFSMRLAALALLLTVALGLWRAANYAGWSLPPAPAHVGTAHLAWGLGGWVLLLVMGVGYQVIPMFHVTPAYPSWLARAMPVAVFVSLLALTFGQASLTRDAASACLAVIAIVYAAYTVALLQRRRRRLPDVTVRFWRLSLASLMLAALSLLAWTACRYTAAPAPPQMAMLIGALVIYGFAVSVILGMLQKIVPFLVFLHLQRASMARPELLATLPHMGELIPASRARWQFRWHCAALLGLLLAAGSAAFAVPAGLLLTADFAWLAFTLSAALRRYRTTAQCISD